jgi:hypothetical protein
MVKANPSPYETTPPLEALELIMEKMKLVVKDTVV